MSYLIDQRRLLFWQKMLTSDNVVLYAMSRLIVNQFIAIGSHYGITSYQMSSNMLRLKVGPMGLVCFSSDGVNLCTVDILSSLDLMHFVL